MQVVVWGSLNVDVALSCDTLPSPGETIPCSSVRVGPGGKGLNQAVAARRAGADVALSGTIGTDAHGDILIAFLRDEGVDTAGIRQAQSAPTGTAYIMVDRQGENMIVVAGGANTAEAAGPPRVAPVDGAIWLAQLETDIGGVEAFLRAGRAAGVRTILNAAPVHAKAEAIFAYADTVVVNEHELAQFSGRTLDPADEAAIAAAGRAILKRDDQAIVVTLGAAGTQWIDGSGSSRISAHRVHAVDTTGAGDCFCGVLAATLAQGRDLDAAIKRANMAAALAVGSVGAARAMPTASAIDAALTGNQVPSPASGGSG